jgi:site-specific recombinase XerC
MRLDPDLPAWVKKAIKADPHARFLQINFGSGQTKNGNPVRELMPLELTGIYSHYLKFRKFLVDKDHDDGTLFVNSRGRRLSRQACGDLYQKLVRKWLDRHARPHLNRDSYCEHELSHGGTRRQIGKKLWQKAAVSTERYCRRYDASYGAVALENKLNHASKRRAA